MRALERAVIACFCMAIFLTIAGAQVGRPATGSDSPPAFPSALADLSSLPRSSQDVIYENGKLSIVADNSTLPQILDTVRAKTGAVLEGAPAFDSSRVTVALGPDDPVRVLGALLYGTQFNYVILGSTDAGRLAKIILMPRNDTSTAQGTVIAAAIVTPPTLQVPPFPAESAKLDPVQPAGAADAAEKPNTADTTSDEKQSADKKDENGNPDSTDGSKDKDKVADNKDATDKDKNGGTASDDKSVASIKATGDKKPSSGGTDQPEEATEEASATDKMSNLPPGINPAIAALYPSLLSGGGANQTSSPANGTQTASATQPATPVPTGQPIQSRNAYPAGVTLPTNSAGVPILPSNIPPEMWGLYPSDLMQLIRSNNPPPVIPLTPLSPTIQAPAPGQSIFWDQTLTGHH